LNTAVRAHKDTERRLALNTVNLDLSFLSGSEKNDGCGKMIDAGAYIKLIKMIRFPYMYLLNQKMYTNNVIVSTVKSTLRYFFLRKS
jgi:hypothetical protein